MSNARLFAIKITVLWGIMGYLDYTVIPSIDFFSRMLAIPFFVSWMLYLLNNKRYNRIVRDLEEISI